MKILRVWMWPILLSLTVFLALGVPDVNAAALQFTSGAVQTTINDGQILADFDPTAGSVVAVNTAVDTWLINSAAGITKPAPAHFLPS